MKLSCDKYEFLVAVNTALRAVPSKSPILSLEGILLEASPESLKVTGYDLKKGIYSTIEADVMESGIAIINGRLLAEMVRRMPDGTLYIVEDNGKINFKCSKNEYELSTLDKNEYPELPVFEKIQELKIKQSVLRSMINQTIFAVAKEEVRPIYTGSLFEIENGVINLVSVDGYRLARRTEVLEGNDGLEAKFVVPGFTLSDIEKICTDSEENALINVGEKHVSFVIGNTVVISRKIDGEFLNHKKSVPESFKYTIKVERSEIISSIERVSLMLSSSSSTNPVKMSFSDGRINLSCHTPVGRAEDVCLSEGNGDNLEVGFNDRFMIDALKATGDKEIYLCLNTSSSPCIIKSAEGNENYTFMVLPVRLH